MIKSQNESCEGCKNDLGGGRDNCRINLSYECRDGGGFEAYESDEDNEYEVDKTMNVQEEKYILTLTKDQAEIVEMACQILARLEIGQFNIITEIFLNYLRGVEDYCHRRDAANAALEFACGVIFGLNHYGKPDCEKTEIHHHAWSVYTTLRYARSWHEHPEGGYSVCFDKPMAYSDEPLPKCEIVSNEQKGRKNEG